MPERSVPRLPLAGRVIQDLLFTPVETPAFSVALDGWPRPPQYKAGGLFVFSDVPPGERTLVLSGPRFQTRTLPVTLPSTPPVPGPPLLWTGPGEDEVVVRLTAAPAAGNGIRRLSFPKLFLPRPIRTGARVLAEGVASRLAAELEVGEVVMAEVEEAPGLGQLQEGSLVRLVRDDSLRLRHDPYSQVPAGLPRVVGRITAAGSGAGLSGARVEAAAFDGESIAEAEVAGAPVATVAGGTHVLGSASDLTTETNDRGDYNLYFPTAPPFSELTLSISHPGFASRTETVSVGAGRSRGDFTLTRT